MSSELGVKMGGKMRDELFDFENLRLYQRALEYVDFVYRVTRTFPKEEMFSLTDQFKRAASSICLNIAEGSGGTKAEFNQYLKIARRSTRECVAISELSCRQAYFEEEMKRQSRMFCTEISKMLSGLMKSI